MRCCGLRANTTQMGYSEVEGGVWRRQVCLSWRCLATGPLLGFGLVSAALLTFGWTPGTLELRAMWWRRAAGLAALPTCRMPEEDTDYLTETSLDWVRGAGSPEACQKMCEASLECGVWVWSRQQDFCVLKALEPSRQPRKKAVKDVFSGFPCRAVDAPADSMEWPHGLPLGGEPPVKKSSHGPAGPSRGRATLDQPAWAWAGQPEAEAEAQAAASGQRVAREEPAAAQEARSAAPHAVASWTRLALPLHGGPSLFCYAVMLPKSYEETLLLMQYKKKWGIFSCAEAEIYSNREVRIGSLTTVVVNSDLKADVGGDFNTALNTPVFLAVWHAVFAGGRYLKHDWTVKADPDTVFFPDRLRRMLLGHEEDPRRGVYFNNCKYGLHGPIEVFSRNALRVLQAGAPACVAHLTKLCSGPCPFGEDMFFDKCLVYLQVEREDNYDLIMEEHCDGGTDYLRCDNPSKVSFHPFKTKQAYRTCIQNAMEGAVVADSLLLSK